MGVADSWLSRLLAWRLLPPLLRWTSVAYAAWPRFRLMLYASQRDAYWAQMPVGQRLDLLDQILAVDREVVAQVAADSPDRSEFLRRLSQDLQCRYLLQDDVRDLDDSINAGRAAVAATKPGDPNVARYLCSVATSLALLYDQRKHIALLDEAITFMIGTLWRTRSADAQLAGYFDFLCELLQTRIAEGATEYLPAALEATCQLLPHLTLSGDLTTAGLAEVGDALRVRALSAPKEHPLADFISFARVAIAQSRPGDPHRPAHLANLAALLFLLADRDGAPDLIRESVDLRRELVDHTSVDDPAMSERLHSWGHASRVRYELTGDLQGLDDAVTAHRRGAALAAQSAPMRRSHLAGLSEALRLRYHQCGDEAALRHSVTVAQAALGACSPDDADRAELLNQVAITLQASFHVTGDMGDVVGAVEMSREAVAAASDHDADWSLYHANLCMALNELFGVKGGHDIVAAAIEAGRTATSAPGRVDHWAWSNLANALYNEHLITGDITVLKEAITSGRRAIDAALRTHRSASSFMHSQALYLSAWYLWSGDPGDLDESIELHRQALALTPLGASARLEHAWAVGDALLLRAVAESDDGALGEAREILRTVVASARPGNPRRGLYLIDLAGTLWEWFSRHKDPDALDEGIGAAQEAAEILAPGTFLHTYARVNLAILLMSRYTLKGNRADGDAAVAIAADAAARIPPGTPNHARALQNLGDALHARFTGNGDQRDYDAAITALGKALAAEPGEIQTRIDAARELAKFAADAGDWVVAADAMRDAIALIPRLAPRHFRRHHAERVLARFPGLASDAAAVAVRVVGAEAALELLEQGRGVLLEQELETRGYSDEVRERDPSLAAQLDDLRRRSDQPAGGVPNTSVPGDRILQTAHWHPPHATQEGSWDDLLARIRAVPGLERFLQPPSGAELATVAAAGPIMAINVSQYRSDAFLITADGVRVVPLPRLTRDGVDRHAASYAEAIAVGHDELAPLRQRRQAEDSVRATLAWLWDAVAEPLLAELHTLAVFRSAHHLPRIWWIPTGHLNFLPLHAAGHYAARTFEPLDVNANLLDRVVSSYTPTLRALLRARRPAAPPGGNQPFVVAVPSSAGDDLAHAQAEVDTILHSWPGSHALIGAAATVKAVLAHLPQAGWVHFACHAWSDIADPSQSYLLLHDGRLSVADISGLRLRHAEFAMLSACSTARGGVRLPDESIHLTGAFHLAGYRHVVGSMWPVADDAAHRLTAHLYSTMQADPSPSGSPAFDDSARALHAAVQHLREQWPWTPSMWTPWIHVGA